MKALKIILIALLALVLIGAAAAYFMPNRFSVTRSVEINKSVDVVYSQVSDFGKWPAWDPWLAEEPTAKHGTEGTPGTPGHKSTWEGEKLGQGEHTISAVETNKLMVADLHFIKPFDSKAKDSWTFESMADHTKVSWTTEGDLPFGIARLMGPKIQKDLGGQMEKGLANLKNVCEALPAPEAPPVPADSNIIAGAVH